MMFLYIIISSACISYGAYYFIPELYTYLYNNLYNKLFGTQTSQSHTEEQLEAGKQEKIEAEIGPEKSLQGLKKQADNQHDASSLGIKKRYFPQEMRDLVKLEQSITQPLTPDMVTLSAPLEEVSPAIENNRAQPPEITQSMVMGESAKVEQQEPMVSGMQLEQDVARYYMAQIEESMAREQAEFDEKLRREREQREQNQARDRAKLVQGITQPLKPDMVTFSTPLEEVSPAIENNRAQPPEITASVVMGDSSKVEQEEAMDRVKLGQEIARNHMQLEDIARRCARLEEGITRFEQNIARDRVELGQEIARNHVQLEDIARRCTRLEEDITRFEQNIVRDRVELKDGITRFEQAIRDVKNDRAKSPQVTQAVAIEDCVQPGQVRQGRKNDRAQIESMVEEFYGKLEECRAQIGNFGNQVEQVEQVEQVVYRLFLKEASKPSPNILPLSCSAEARALPHGRF